MQSSREHSAIAATSQWAIAFSALPDVLVEGAFVQAKKDIALRFRESSNQRLLDMPKTLESGEPTIWHDDPVFETHSM